MSSSLLRVTSLQQQQEQYKRLYSSASSGTWQLLAAVKSSSYYNPTSFLRSTTSQHQQQYNQHQHTQLRALARSSAPVDETPYDKAVTFVISVGHDPQIAKGVVDALVEAGMSSDGEVLLQTVRQMAGRWEVGEDEGLDALVASVEQSMKLKENKQIIKIKVIPPNAWKSSSQEYYNDISNHDNDGMTTQEELKRSFDVEALEGTTLTDVAKFGTHTGASTLGEYIECACSGIMACSTCHVVISKDWFPKVGEPCEAEQDMLDLAYNPQHTSRLGCQIVLTKELDGLVIKIPASANNLMDFVPFQD